MKPQTFGWYPANRIVWDNTAQLLHAESLDALIKANTRSNNGLKDDFIEHIELWGNKEEVKKQTQYHHFYKLPLTQLQHVARTSQLQFRALFALSCIWQIKEGHRAIKNPKLFKGKHIYATQKNGEPRPAAYTHLPVFSRQELTRLCYTEDQWNTLTRDHTHRAKKAIQRLHDLGYVVILPPRPYTTVLARPYADPWK